MRIMGRLLPWVGSILASLTFLGCGPREGLNTLQIRGSDTEVNLVQSLAEAYMTKNAKASIAVTGGGSGVGIAALMDKRTDIANSSRPMKDEEVEQARAKGVEPVGIIFALDGLSIIVHKDNPLLALTLQEVGQIYRGEVTNWKEVGGPDLPMSLYGRQSNSGTYIYFRDTVLKGDYSLQMKEMNGTAQIVEGVKRDRAGIGYVGLGYVVEEGKPMEGLKIVSIAQDESSKPVSPLKDEEVREGNYALLRGLYQYIYEPQNEMLKDFLRFELSPEGQKLIQEEGFFPVAYSKEALAHNEEWAAFLNQ